jgi:hypothetical protein
MQIICVRNYRFMQTHEPDELLPPLWERTFVFLLGVEKSQCVSDSSISAHWIIMQKLNEVSNENLNINILLNLKKKH